MAGEMDKVIELAKAGKQKEAQALLESLKKMAEFEPDTIKHVAGKPVSCTKRGKPVERGVDGVWRRKK